MLPNNTIEFTLQNGLKVVLLQDKTTPLCVVSVLYNVGSKNENPDKTGLAHLMEHLMFEGSKNVPDFDLTFQKIGGDSNAYTNSDITHYYNTLPAQNLETALWIEADRMDNLSINKTSLEKQKKIVLEEYHETVFNETYGDMWHKVLPILYPNNPYQWPTIGKSLDSIKAFKIEDILDFYKSYYNPNNAVLVIGGPDDFENIKEKVELYFGHIQNHDSTVKKYTYDTTTKEDSKPIYGEANTPRSAFYMAFPMASRFENAFYKCDIISDILGTGESSRLFKTLVHDTEMLTDIQCYVNATYGPGLLIIEGRLSPDITHETAENAVWKILDGLKSKLITDNELLKFKNKIVTDRAFSEANIANKVLNLGVFKAVDKLDVYAKEPKIYNNITSQEIKDQAITIFDKEKYLCLRYVPKEVEV